MIFPAATDSRHFMPIARNVYRFFPVELTPEEFGAIHSTNESIAISGYLQAISFYSQFIQRTTRNNPNR
jgi:carboxypeptidase PM20D1